MPPPTSRIPIKHPCGFRKFSEHRVFLWTNSCIVKQTKSSACDKAKYPRNPDKQKYLSEAYMKCSNSRANMENSRIQGTPFLHHWEYWTIVKWSYEIFYSRFNLWIHLCHPQHIKHLPCITLVARNDCGIQNLPSLPIAMVMQYDCTHALHDWNSFFIAYREHMRLGTNT